jgi:hypothetical protein
MLILFAIAAGIRHQLRHEPALHRLDRAPHASVDRRQKADRGDKQRACVQLVRPVSLDEGADTTIERLFAHVLVDLGAELAPVIDRPLKAEGLRALDRPVECDPCHHLRVG